jgi:hypothetical protein
VEIPEKLQQIMKHEGVVAIATHGQDGPHLVNTWNSDLQLTGDGCLLIPAGGMHHTETNLAFSNRVLLTLGSREVQGQHGPGAGFLVEGTAEFLPSGPDFAAIKAARPWARAALAIHPDSITQTL